MKQLRTIFSFDNEYQLPPSILTSDKPNGTYFEQPVVIYSDGFPENCPYFRWRSLTDNRDKIAWVNGIVSPRREIIQLNAWQLVYKIDYSITTDDDYELKLIIPFNGQYGNEPWDYNGDEIEFSGKNGSFCIPGWYQFFVIRSNTSNISIKLTISTIDINLYRHNTPNLYFFGYDKYICLINKCSVPHKVYKYVNNDNVTRVVEPKYQKYSQEVYYDYMYNRRYYSCFGSTNNTIGQFTTNTASMTIDDQFIGNWGPVVNGQVIDECGTTQFYPFQTIVVQDHILAISDANMSIFTVNFDNKDTISVSFTGTISIRSLYWNFASCDTTLKLILTNCGKNSVWSIVLVNPIRLNLDSGYLKANIDFTRTIPRNEDYNLYCISLKGSNVLPSNNPDVTFSLTTTFSL